jgi:ZIP family zinc transporter
LVAAAAFLAGVVFTAVIDKVIGGAGNVHEIRRAENGAACVSGGAAPGENEGPRRRRFRGGELTPLYRVGVLTAVAVAVHNFPEGLATFTVSFRDAALGIPIALAVAIHNIPEGIAVSVPICYATGNRRKAFFYSFLSGLAEPVGGVLGFLVLLPFLSDALFGVLFAAVAGIMVFISLDELLPAAREYGEHHLSIYGLVAGMAVMAFSLALFRWR